MIVTTTTCPTTTAGNEFCEAGIANSECQSGTCKCDSGYTPEDDLLSCTEVVIGSTPCGHSDNAQYCESGVANSECKNGTCQCDPGNTVENDSTTCTPVVIDSTTCGHSSDPDNYCSQAISNSVCSDSGICICAEGYGATPDYLGCFRMTIVLSPAMRVRVAADEASSRYTYSGFGRAYVQAIYSGNSADAQTESDLIDGNVEELQTSIGNMYDGTYADMVSLVNDYTEWGMDQAYRTSVTEARNDILTLSDAAARMATDWDDCMLAPLLPMTRSLADQYEAYHQAAQTMADAAESHVLHGTQWAIDYMNSEADLARSISVVLDDAMAQLSAQIMDAAGFAWRLKQ